MRIALAFLSILFCGLAVAQEGHVDTDRDGARLLALPPGDEAWQFAIFGDRTGGPREGIKVLAQAVADTNLLDPDLVMTVGDLVQGYNAHDEWMEQCREYRATMDGLRRPWYPVVGNHDIYWRGEGRPRGEHEGDFEQNFGPLWYSFHHKNATFIALYSDEGDLEADKKDFNLAGCQRMSPAQMSWLRKTLDAARGDRHVFVFLHHPWWIESKYPGSNWKDIHAMLAAAGNVRAVFAGHIHQMRYDGVKDGIEYYALAATGAHFSHDLPRAGFLHHLDLVTVREQGISVTTIPVGCVLDPKAVTGRRVEEIARLMNGDLVATDEPLQVSPGRRTSGAWRGTIGNPTGRPIEITLVPSAAGGPWTFMPDHVHLEIPSGGSVAAEILYERKPRSEDAKADAAVGIPTLGLVVDYLAEDCRITLPERRIDLEIRPIALDASFFEPVDSELELDGKDDAARVESGTLDLPDGPFTLEGWLRADVLEGRRPFLSKAEQSEFGLFVGDGRPAFMVFLDDRYVTARAEKPLIAVGERHHLAGVFDGLELRLYLDGKRVAQVRGRGRRRTNELPLVIGADPTAKGKLVDYFAGRIDEVRVSDGARYVGAEFEPQARFEPDAATRLLLHFDREIGVLVPDHSAGARHARLVGRARLRPR